MTQDPATGRWNDITDADVNWMLDQGFNANEIAAIARVTIDAATHWVARVTRVRLDPSKLYTLFRGR